MAPVASGFRVALPSLLLALPAFGLNHWPPPPAAGPRGAGFSGAVTALKVAEEFGGRAELCRYFGWEPRPEAEPRPRLVFATTVGNQGQQDVYELIFAEVYPLVERIVAADPLMTFQGLPRQPSINISDPRWDPYRPRLRHLVLESPLSTSQELEEMGPEMKDALRRPGHKAEKDNFLIEQWVRSQMHRGLRDLAGAWDVRADDILIVADSDEIPLRESLAALLECENPTFARVRSQLAQGAAPRDVCAKDAKVLLASQVFEYYTDCPIQKPVWWHPDAVLAACVTDGGLDMEEVRTGSSGEMTPVCAARHVHNLFMSNEDIVFKYKQYAEPRKPDLDAGLDSATNDEMRWRACDAKAPDLGTGGWHMAFRPSNDFVDQGNRRGFYLPAEKRRGVDRPFALLAQRPELAEKAYWRGHGELVNPFVGKPAGPHDYSEGWVERKQSGRW